MTLTVKLEGFVNLNIPKDIAEQYRAGKIDIEKVFNEMSDEISEIDCGKLTNIDSKPVKIK